MRPLTPVELHAIEVYIEVYPHLRGLSILLQHSSRARKMFAQNISELRAPKSLDAEEVFAACLLDK
jgi:hypothetical protein